MLIKHMKYMKSLNKFAMRCYHELTWSLKQKLRKSMHKTMLLELWILVKTLLELNYRFVSSVQVLKSKYVQRY